MIYCFSVYSLVRNTIFQMVSPQTHRPQNSIVPAHQQANSHLFVYQMCVVWKHSNVQVITSINIMFNMSCMCITRQWARHRAWNVTQTGNYKCMSLWCDSCCYTGFPWCYIISSFYPLQFFMLLFSIENV